MNEVCSTGGATRIANGIVVRALQTFATLVFEGRDCVQHSEFPEAALDCDWAGLLQHFAWGGRGSSKGSRKGRAVGSSSRKECGMRRKTEERMRRVMIKRGRMKERIRQERSSCSSSRL